MPQGYQFSSSAPQTFLQAAISNSDLSIQVASSSGFPSTPFHATIDIGESNQEVVAVTNITGTNWTITRNVDNTGASAHGFEATVTHSAIGMDLREFRAHLDAASSPDGQSYNVHGIATGSSVVGTTDAQTLTNKTLTAPTINGGTISTPTITTPNVTDPVITGGASIAGGLTISSGGEAVTGNTTQSGGTSTHTDLTVANDVVGSVPLTVNAISGTTADLLDLKVNGSTLAKVDSSGNQLAATVAASGLSGSLTASRFAGGTAGGPPASGTYVTGDVVVDTKYGCLWLCTSGGTPGTWVPIGDAQLGNVNVGSGGASAVTFSNIPGYWRDLEFTGYLTMASGGPSALLITYSNSGGAVTGGYYSINGGGNGSAPTTYTGSYNASGSSWSAIGSAGSFPGPIQGRIPDYSGSEADRVIFCDTCTISTTSSNSQSRQGAGVNSTAGAVTALSFSVSGINWAQGTFMELWGKGY